MVGKTLSHYHISGKLGQGGMGEVYRAEDSVLKREVAIKVLPGEFTQDPERLARFQREAQVLASLNHPNIATIYGLEEADGVRFLVLELVEGETLAQRLMGGPLPVEESLEICLQITEGLETAHESGVIHRDLKPANLMITPENKVKILDFGLAKALDAELSQQELANSPTITSEMSRPGVILGTAAYMSPEQARGKTVDKRADIWAFGCVLYECLTGRQLFGGETITDCIAKVLQREPDWEVLPEGTPWRIRDLLRRCLEKDPHHRLQHIGDTRIEIEQAQSEPDDSALLQPKSEKPGLIWGRMAPFLLLVGLVASLVTWLAIRPGPAPSLPTSRFVIPLPATAPLGNLFTNDLAVSPDGEHIVYFARGSGLLCHRAIDALETRIIAGTEGAREHCFSPDGEWIAFRREGKLMKVRIGGGPAMTILEEPEAVTPLWGPDGTMIFLKLGKQGGLFRIPADRSKPPERLTEGNYSTPQIVPGGNAVLFSTELSESGQVGVLSLETGEERILFPGTQANYAPSGHLVFAREGGLLAVPFDLERLQVTGEAVTLVENVRWPYGKFVDYAVSETGTLVYVPRPAEKKNTLVWVDREGREDPLATEALEYRELELSPDGKRLAITVLDSGNSDIRIYHLEHETSIRLTTHPADDGHPTWTPDGERVVFRSNRDGGSYNLFWKAADGTGGVERLTKTPRMQRYPCVSPDGKWLVFDQINPETRHDSYLLSFEEGASPAPLLQTEFVEGLPAISPDGRWIAYASLRTGQAEIYVRPFPDVGEGMWPISTTGGNAPVWGPDGRELFYRGGPKLDTLMVAPIEAGANFIRGKPQALFKTMTDRYFYGDGDIAPDGKRFLMIKASEQANETRSELIVVFNWFEELKRLVPAGN